MPHQWTIVPLVAVLGLKGLVVLISHVLQQHAVCKMIHVQTLLQTLVLQWAAILQVMAQLVQPLTVRSPHLVMNVQTLLLFLMVQMHLIQQT
jgi:hypothetical protein